MVNRIKASSRAGLGLVLGAALFHATDARADAPPEPTPAADSSAPSVRPHISHAPVSTSPAGKALVVRATIEHPHLVRRALFVYRLDGQTQFREVEFLRASDGPSAATVPASDVQAPALAYTIELEDLEGKRHTVFASRQRPHTVQVPEALMDLRERALLERLGGRRSVVATSAEFVLFGDSVADVRDPATGNVTKQDVSDRYYRIEASYTYRMLRHVTEFSVRAGVVRGNSPVPLRDPLPGQSEDERFDVGLNYGGPTVRVRAHDAIHLEAEVLTSVTEVGFSWGGGGAVLLGDPYGSKLTLGFESIETFGTRFFSRVDLAATDTLTLAPVVEVTNMPSADRYGLRLLGEVGMNVGQGLHVALRGGYQARDAASGGPSIGGRLSYAFD